MPHNSLWALQTDTAADVLREYGLTADQIAETVKANI